MTEQVGGLRSAWRGIERAGMKAVFGLDHPNYRQLVWRRSGQDPDELAWSDTYKGNPNLKLMHPQAWRNLAVIAVRKTVMEALWYDHHDAVPAVAYKNAKGQVVVGALPEDAYTDKTRGEFSTFTQPEPEPEPEPEHGIVSIRSYFAHAFRLGTHDTQFTAGFQLPDQTIITPAAEDIDSYGPVTQLMVGRSDVSWLKDISIS